MVLLFIRLVVNRFKVKIMLLIFMTTVVPLWALIFNDFNGIRPRE